MLEGTLADEDVERAMRTFEALGGPLRYPESQKWHLRDIMAMRKVLEEFAALRASGAGGEMRTLDEWTEEDGDVLWWRFPIEEPPYLGSPLRLGQEVLVTVSRFGHEDGKSRHLVGGWPGYHTHWTRFQVPALPLDGGRS